MGQHDPFRFSCGSRCVLENRQARVDRWGFMELDSDRSIEGIGADQIQAVGLAPHILVLENLLYGVMRRQCRGGLAVLRDPLDAGSFSIAARRISGYRDAARIQATEKSHHKLNASRGVEEQATGASGVLF